MKPARIHYPWLSTLGAVAILCWQMLLARPELLPQWRLPPPLLEHKALYTALGIFTLLVVFDIWVFLRASRRCRAQLLQYQEQIGELFDSKRELGTRART